MHTYKCPCGHVLSFLLGSYWECSCWRNSLCCNPPASLGTSEVWTVPVGLSECMDSEKQMRQVLCPIAQRLTCVVGRWFPSRNLALNPPFAPHLFKAEEPRAGQHRRAGMSFETRLLGTQAPIHPFWQVDGSQHLHYWTPPWWDLRRRPAPRGRFLRPTNSLWPAGPLGSPWTPGLIITVSLIAPLSSLHWPPSPVTVCLEPDDQIMICSL